MSDLDGVHRPATTTSRRRKHRARAITIALATIVLVAATACQPPPVGTITDFGQALGAPKGIVTGPDGNLWFTNNGQRFDRAHHDRRPGDDLPRHAISDPIGIVTGPDGALWFTNNGNNTIGRITTAGAVTNFTGTASTSRRPASRRARRRPLVHQHRQQHDRPDHHRRRGPTSPAPASASPNASRPGPTATSGSRTGRRTRSGASPRRAWSRTSPIPRLAHPTAIAAGPDGRLWFANGTKSAGHIATDGAIVTFVAGAVSQSDSIVAGPDGAMWLDQLRQQHHRPDQDGRRGDALPGHGHQPTERDHRRPRRRPLVHRPETGGRIAQRDQRRRPITTSGSHDDVLRQRRIQAPPRPS